MENQAGAAWKAVALMIIAMAMADMCARPPIYNGTGIYVCQGKASDFDSPKSLWQVLQISNTTVWPGKDVWGCKFAFVQDGFHQGLLKPIQIGTECCDTCFTNCSEFRLKIEGCETKAFRIKP